MNEQKLRGSNIVDLVGDVLRNRKTAKTPTHSEEFIKLLANLNVPEEFVKNRNRISSFRFHKQNAQSDDDDEVAFRRRQVAKARKRYAESSRFEGTKRYLSPIKKFKWHPI